MESRSIDSTESSITEATLTAQYVLQGGSAKFFLTNNGGTIWSPVVPGITHVFTTTGSDLRWRVDLSADPVWHSRSPIIESLQIDYTVTSASGDDYEPDDTCAQAAPLQVNGAAQTHTFHQYQDSDWGWFDATAGVTYILQTTNTGERADTVLEVYNQCGQPPTDREDNAFGPGASLSFAAPSSGRYYVRVLQQDSTVFGENTNYDLSVRTQQITGAAIIVAGRLRTNDAVQPMISASANLAYQNLLRGGLSPANIHYLNADLSQPGVDDTPTKEHLRDAIQTWARSRVGLGTPLWLYLVDHGDVDRFHNEVGEVVSAAELDLWLSNLEATTGVDQINVILDACFSGSFIDTQLSGDYGLNEISGHGRLVIASTSSRWWAYGPPMTPGQAPPPLYFSSGFWPALGSGSDAWIAFLAGRARVEADLGRCGDYDYSCQRPWLDDTGDAWFDAADGLIAQGRGLAAAMAGGVAPYIDWITVDRDSGKIQAQVRDDGSITRVWARVFAPSFTLPEGTTGEVPIIEVPEVELVHSSNDTFVASNMSFSETGPYQVVVYARDQDGDVSSPKSAATAQKEVSWPIYLPVVITSSN